MEIATERQSCLPALGVGQKLGSGVPHGLHPLHY